MVRLNLKDKKFNLIDLFIFLKKLNEIINIFKILRMVFDCFILH